MTLQASGTLPLTATTTETVLTHTDVMRKANVVGGALTWLRIHNTSGTTMQFLIDGGVYIDLPATGIAEGPYSFTTFKFKTAAGSAAFTLMFAARPG